MSEALRAVGSRASRPRPIKPDHGAIWDAMEELHGRVDGLQEALEAGHQSVAREIRALVDVIGTPADGGQGATGIFAHISGHDGRLKKFERLWERGVGAAMVAGPMLVSFGAFVWWIAGDKIGPIFHG